MKLGFHYHTPAYLDDQGTIVTAGYLGVFIDSLAAHCDELVCILHEPTHREIGELDYKIISTNVKLVGIGEHLSLPKRLLNVRKIKKILVSVSGEFDCFLIRAPTPLLPFFYYVFKTNPFAIYLVGSYVEGAKHLKSGFIKKSLIRIYSEFIEFTQRKIAENNNLVIVNSRVLLEEYQKIYPATLEIRSTTLSLGDVFLRQFSLNQSDNKPIRILYTGRLDPIKGITEILQACIKLHQEGFCIEFHIAGLLVKGLDKYPEELRQLAVKENFEAYFFYHGRKQIGDELNSLYRACDIYVLASKSNFEGFPRTIWEAMANSLPVIASRVGSIPYFLQHEESALLTAPGEMNEIYNSIKRLIYNPSLGNKMINNGLSLAKGNTLETQSKKMIGAIRKHLNDL